MIDWRSYGRIPESTFRAELDAVGSPMAREVEPILQAAGEHSALMTAMCIEESRLATAFNRNVPTNRNPLNLRPRGGTGYLKFASYTDCIKEWVSRITDPNYAYAGTITVQDLVAVYAPASDSNDPEAYAANILARFVRWGIAPKEVSPVSTELVFGNVPHPEFKDRPIWKAESKGQNDLGQRSVKGVTWHRMLGSLVGTDGYFRLPEVNALTDYGVGVAASEPVLAGVIYRWNDPLGTQSGWASGTYSSAAYGDGAAFVAKYGVNAINRDRASIEISGNYNTPLDDDSRHAIAAITAYWADQAEIPWDVFPIVPADGFSFVCWHNEFGPDFGQKICPGPVVMTETAALIEFTRQILKAGQLKTVPAPTPIYAEPILPAWFDDALEQIAPSDATIDGVAYRVMRRNFEAVVDTTRRSAPDIKAAPSGPKLLAGEKVRGERLVDGERDWILTNDGHYILASKLSPAVTVRRRRAA